MKIKIKNFSYDIFEIGDTVSHRLFEFPLTIVDVYDSNNKTKFIENMENFCTSFIGMTHNEVTNLLPRAIKFIDDYYNKDKIYLLYGMNSYYEEQIVIGLEKDMILLEKA